MKKRPKWKQTLQYIAARGALGLAGHLTLSQAQAFGRWVGGCYCTLNPKRRDVAIQNLLRTQVAASPEEAKRIARRSFEHFGIMGMESLRKPEDLRLDQPDAKVVEALHPEMRALLDARDEGAIVVTGHIGNWEAAGRILASHRPVSAVAAKIRNPRVDALLKELRAFPNLTMLPKRSADGGRLIRVLRAHEVLALLIDQRGRKRDPMIDFFGIPVRMFSSPVILHLYTGAPLCFGACLREPDGRLRLESPAPIRYPSTGNREADVRAILELVNGHLEAVIRAYPEQYLWAHRRWRDG